MPAHVFNVPQPYRASAEERTSRSKLRWFGDTFRLSSRSRSSSANGRGSLSQPQQKDDNGNDEFVMRTSPPKPSDVGLQKSQSSSLGRRSVARQDSNQVEAVHMRSHKSSGSPRSSQKSMRDSSGYESLSDTDDSSFRKKFGLPRKSLHATSPSSFNSVHTLSFKSTTPLDDDEYDSLSDPDDDGSASPLKGKQVLVTSPESYNSLRSSTASTVSTAVSSDYSPSSRSSFTSTADSETASPLDIASPRVEYETRKLLRNVMGLDAAWESDLQARRHYENLHWRVVRIQADGNCLFRAISDQIYRNEAFHTDIRRRVMDFITRKQEFFQPFVEHEEPGRVEQIDAYCKRMQQDGQWGGNPELYAAARLFNVHIVVHQGPLRRLRITNESKHATDNKEPFMELHLLYHHNHYDSLHDEANVDDKGRLSLTADLAANHQHDAVDESVDEPSTTNNQIEITTNKARKGKRVVFLGEQTRVERVDMPTVEVFAPRRAVLRRGKVESMTEPAFNSHQPTADHEVDNRVDQDVYDTDSEDESLDANDMQQEIFSDPTDDEEPETEVRFATVKRICFRKGRRIE